MFHKFVLLSLTSLGFAAPLALPAQAEAGPKFRIEINGRQVLNPFVQRPVQFGPAGPGFFPQAPVAPIGIGPHQDNHYHVLFRVCDHDAWREYGSYNCHELAHEIENRLRARGMQTQVVHH